MDANIFWSATTEELKQGYKSYPSHFTCLLCGENFNQGEIYPINNAFFDAEKATQTHVATAHPDIFEYYLNFGKVYTGLSEGHTELAKLFYKGHTDKEIIEITNANSVSTIRNQRFAIREKYKQAKILIALVELMEEKMHQQKQERKLVDFHPSATCVDERFAITQGEKENNNLAKTNGKLHPR